MRGIGKKGVEIAISTIIMIILGLAVLTILIVFFNSRASDLSEQTGESESNVDSVVSACNSLVSLESYYSYCCEKKEVVLNSKESFRVACVNARSANWSSDRIKELDCSEIICSE